MANYTGGSRFNYNAIIYHDDRDGIDKVEYKSPTLEPDDTDIIHEITPGQEYRPDLISLQYYSRSDLEWTILLLNKFDHFREFYVGRLIRISKLERMQGKIF